MNNLTWFESFDREEYSGIPLLKMSDNNHGGMPIFVRKYNMLPTTTLKDTNVLHRHEYMQINYVYQGKAEYLVKNQRFIIGNYK